MVPRSSIYAVAVIVLFAASVLLQVWRDRTYGDSRAAEQVLYVASGNILGKLGLSYDALLADVYWIRAIQHYGGTRRSATTKRYDLLQPLLNIATTLDPYFVIVYRFGAVFLSEPYPGGPGRSDQAIELLQKGIRRLPHKWEFYLDAGFVNYWTLGDYAAAADWFARGSQVPGAPEWLTPMAARALTHGRDRRTARFMLEQLLHAEQEYIRSNARFRLSQLSALDDLDRLNERLTAFDRQTGRFPRDWDELTATGLLVRTPVDPSGVPYQLDADHRAVRLSPDSPLNPLPTQQPGKAVPR